VGSAVLEALLEEAVFYGLEVDSEGRVAAMTAAVLAEPVLDDDRVSIRLAPLGRVAAAWWLLSGGLVPMAVEDVLVASVSVAGCSLLGPFVDAAEPFPSGRSLDWRGRDGAGSAHTLDLACDGGNRGRLDVRLWFDDVAFVDPDGCPLDGDDLLRRNRAWWTSGRGPERGIYPI